MNLLKRFLARIDDGTVFADDGRALRGEVRESFINLLLHHRPFLEEETGPVLALPGTGKASTDLMESDARQGKTAFLRQQAQLFLALLPFPGQWQWLTQGPGIWVKILKSKIISSRKKKDRRKVSPKAAAGIQAPQFLPDPEETESSRRKRHPANFFPSLSLCRCGTSCAG